MTEDALQQLEKYDSCCMTGHRVLPKSVEERKKLKNSLKKVISELAWEGITRFYTGGALGFDTMAAMAVLEMRSCFPQIQLCLAVPYPEQYQHWPWEDIQRYEQILGHADQVEVISPKYSEDCMRKRNYYMVDHSCVCVYYMTRFVRSGTAQTVAYARRKNCRMIDLIAEMDGRSLQEESAMEEAFLEEEEFSQQEMSGIESVYYDETQYIREFLEKVKKQML